MADTKISDMAEAADLTSSSIPIVQGGVNKKAPDTLFMKASGVNNYTTSWQLTDVGSNNYIQLDDAFGLDVLADEVYVASASDLTNEGVNVNITVSGGNLVITGIPTSSAGLTAGMVWNDGGTLKIV